MSDNRQVFQANYEANVVQELPPTGERQFYFPTECRGVADPLIRVRPKGQDAWIGLFEPGTVVSGAVTGIYTTPKEEELCVVSRGEGYLIDVNHPGTYRKVEASPITTVLSSLPHELLIFADLWRIIAYGADGVRWRTGRIAIDGIRLQGIHEDLLYGECERIDGAGAEFQIELGTGNIS